MMSGMHLAACEWFSGPRSVTVSPVLHAEGKNTCKPIEEDEHGVPSAEELVKLYDEIKAFISQRGSTRKNNLHEFLHADGVARDKSLVPKVAHAFAETIRDGWRSFIEGADSVGMTFDGCQGYEDMVFVAGRCSDLQLVDGSLGIAEPWSFEEKQTDLEDKKSTRLAKTLDAGIDAFFESKCKSAKGGYWRGKSNDAAKRFKNILESLVSDRCSEEQLGMRYLSQHGYIALLLFGADTVHE